MSENTTLERYSELMAGEAYSPIENLRFFLSLALTGQDWLDVEPFIEAVNKQIVDGESQKKIQSQEVDPSGSIPDCAILAYDAGNNIRIEATRNLRGETKWKVSDGFGGVLNYNGEWEYEPQPSSRDDEFLSRCRYATAEQAFNALEKSKEI